MFKTSARYLPCVIVNTDFTTVMINEQAKSSPSSCLSALRLILLGCLHSLPFHSSAVRPIPSRRRAFTSLLTDSPLLWVWASISALFYENKKKHIPRRQIPCNGVPDPMRFARLRRLRAGNRLCALQRLLQMLAAVIHAQFFQKARFGQHAFRLCVQVRKDQGDPLFAAAL